MLTFARHTAFTVSDVRGRGGFGPPQAVEPVIEMKLRGRKQRAARDETNQMVPVFKNLGQLLISEVRSTISKSSMVFNP